ncbi:MAG: hypothetical protein H0Z19_08475 [Archaeoglobus sp.]|uniref:hypothetical protein n=1 Tax=Archaeoglobus sp. TaxID=1872626 RepID=UPI001D6D597F|nr:hypothetical protein [Archaeoglobus sp.]MBO8180495.1 hypothetical protein [Archaeoglobus sp.]
MEKVLVSEYIVCMNCGSINREAKLINKFDSWFIFECPKCGAKIPAITLPDSSYWAIFVERIEWKPPKTVEE